MKIENYINEKLTNETKIIALELVAFAERIGIEFYKDNSLCWKDKIYFWLKFQGNCVAFIAIKDPDEPDNMFTIWSGNSKAFESADIDDKMKRIAWKHIDYCDNCGSCNGGKRKIVFGKAFYRVCGCTFRIDNPTVNDLPFLKKMIELSLELP